MVITTEYKVYPAFKKSDALAVEMLLFYYELPTGTS